jgi:hypothetical protein
MFLICIPNINHDYINIISAEYNINIDKTYAIFINGYYFYKVNQKLTSSVSYLIKTYDGELFLVSRYINENDYNTIYINKYIYDNGVAQIYHDDYNIIALINHDNTNKIIEFSL